MEGGRRGEGKGEGGLGRAGEGWAGAGKEEKACASSSSRSMREAVSVRFTLSASGGLLLTSISASALRSDAKRSECEQAVQPMAVSQLVQQRCAFVKLRD